MTRKCVKYNIQSLIEEFNIKTVCPVEIFIDSESEKEIKEFLKQNQKKFRMILFNIIKGGYPDHLYRQEPYDMTAMKFKAENKNPRIYCKEFFNKGKKW